MNRQTQTSSARALIFALSFLLTLVFTVLSFFAAWARDEGTLGSGALENKLADAYSFFRQPTHGLFWEVLKDHGAWFLPLLLVNVFLWALLVERLVSLTIGLVQRITKRSQRRI